VQIVCLILVLTVFLPVFERTVIVY